jgi:N-acetylneuraminic acid mutarotase
MLRGRGVVLISCIATILATGAARARELSFADRVRWQEAIERVYYAHQIGATRRFEDALPRSVLQREVVTYLKQSEALRAVWRTPVTADMLERETERMIRQTRMPERLRELFAALGDDPFLVQECLARPALVDRLTRNLFAFDERFHSGASDEAGRLRAELLRLGLDAFENDSRRSEVELRQTVPGERTPEGAPDGRAIALSPDDYRRRRAAAPDRSGEIGPVQEERDAFVIRVVLGEGPGRFRMANFAVRKRSWDDWWTEASPAFDPSSVEPVAFAVSHSPLVELRPGAPGVSCVPDDTWDNGSLDQLPDARQDANAVWTGSVMVIWGGQGREALNTGGRYDPATDTWTPTSTTGAPTGRYYHQAVWTGGVMIVWGGYLNTGGRYDPVTDTWTPTSTVGAPQPRINFTAVWTGREMVVWGGSNVGYFNTGGRYDPVSDKWTSTSVTGAPTARSYHTAVWTGVEMIVWGGYDGNQNFLGSGGRYDPLTNRWTPTAATDASLSRLLHSAVWTGSEMIIWGGGGGFGSLFATGGRYDPETDSWTPTSTTNAPSPRREHTAVWTGREMVVWGGWNAGDLNTGGRYDPVTDTWAPTSTTNVPLARVRHTAVWTGGVMVVWGGSGDSLLDSGGRYDPATDSWTPTATGQAPSGRSAHTAVWTGNLMIVWGGQDSGPRNTGGEYDPVMDTWTPTTTTEAPAARSLHTAVWTGDEMVVWGGETYEGTLSIGVDTGGRYDPTSGAWRPTSTTDAPRGRFGHTAVWTGSLMVVWGGTPSRTPVDPLNSGARYDPLTDTWTTTSIAEAPAARSSHTAVWTGEDMIVWGGGSITGGRYDPATDTWTPTSVMDSPAARGGHTAIWTGGEMIVWGGIMAGGSGSLNSGGRYYPSTDTWSPVSTLGAPVARYAHTAVWTGSKMVVWGGRASVDEFNSGGRYDPAADAWSPTSMMGVPSPRYFHTAVWTGSAMIVWGGSGTLRSGGRYILGHETDDDGDGLSECSGDCNDGNPAVRPGAVEMCDGLDNDCDGVADNATAPSGIPFLAVQLAGDAPLLSWSPVSQATGYDLVRGDLATLNGSGGDFASATGDCLANDLSDTTLSLSVGPSPGQGFWYLVRSMNCGGNGTYDSGGPGQVGSRDAGIDASAFSCP